VNGEPARNGAAAAAMLSACVGCFTLGGLAVAGDASKAVAGMLTLYKPTGPLSGVSTLAIAVWLAGWLVWHRLWREKTIALKRVTGVALALLALGLLLTFPPFEDLLLGK
jgi:hypothetical protein